ncbi:MAG TPA: class I tRNA ligase family protein, partial [Fimbriimonadaceae bacterium]|nr:class I tRNA ligase family protein [Fimbriimonadaceae bacterium]
AIKDRMYCDGKDWESRRSAQAACHYVLLALAKLLTPLLPHTAEEVYSRIPAIQRLESVHCEVLPPPSPERLAAIEASDLQSKFAWLLEQRAAVFASFESWKAESGVKDSQDVIATIVDRAPNLQQLQSFGEDLPNLFKMSWIEFQEGAPEVTFRPSEYPKCERSRLRRPDVEEADGMMLTARDRRVLGF